MVRLPEVSESYYLTGNGMRGVRGGKEGRRGVYEQREGEMDGPGGRERNVQWKRGD